MICKHLENGVCRVVSLLADADYTTNSMVCKACIDTEQPCDINKITVSMAINHLVSLGSIDKAREVHQTHREVISSQSIDTPLPCLNRGSKIGYADCKCQGNTSIYACSIHGECIKRRLTADPPILVHFNGETSTRHPKYCNKCSDMLDNMVINGSVYKGYVNHRKLIEDISSIYKLIKPTSLEVFDDKSLYVAMLFKSLYGTSIKMGNNHITTDYDDSNHYVFVDVLDKSNNLYNKVIESAASNDGKLISMYNLSNTPVSGISAQVIYSDLCCWSLFQSSNLYYGSIGFTTCAIQDKQFKYGPPVVIDYLGDDLNVRCGKYLSIDPKSSVIDQVIELCAKYKLKTLCVGYEILYTVLSEMHLDFDLVHIKA